MSTQTLYKNYIAAADIAAYRIVKFAAEGSVTAAAAATDALVGITSELPVTAGERCDVARAGMACVEAGAAFAVGVLLTSDAQGRAVAAAPAAGANARVIGMADEAASAAGDVVWLLLSPGSVQG